jgi:hypothetical protein
VALYDMTSKTSLSPIIATTFQKSAVMEREHLQAALRDEISPLGDDLLVIAEEFGDFEGVNRRIDLLCIDSSGRLVVVELKRTIDGGHMELQALRYAAMVATNTTFDDVVKILSNHLAARGKNADSARELLEEHLSDVAEIDEEVPSREVRIILVSANFSQEITTTVLWLRDLYGLDITCVRVTPYQTQDQLLVDIQQVIPLPEATDYMVGLRRREQAAKTAAVSADRYTRYTIVFGDGQTSETLNKRRALLRMVLALHAEGVPIDKIRQVVKERKLQSVPGTLDGDELVDTFVAKYPGSRAEKRWFYEAPIHVDGQTWVFSKMWGEDTEETLEALKSLSSTGLSYARAPDS